MTTTAKPRLIGKVTHFYNHIGVAIVKLNEGLVLGEHLHFSGKHTDFSEPVASMEYNHHQITWAERDQEVGIKVEKPVREGDLVLAADEDEEADDG
ncbi:MAG: hypothetical protein KGJ13_03320 [Patescibacteria group bacterium]|nr:hypothetical protein [Patescibacteria group bacterium]